MSETSIRNSASGSLPTAPADTLALYELQKPFVEPLLRLCRFTKTALDTLFYDVGALTAALLAKGTTIDTGVPSNSSHSRHPVCAEKLDSNILVVQATGHRA
jgi:hypothetical protein